MSSFLDPNFSGQLFKESHQMNKFQKKMSIPRSPLPQKKQTSSFFSTKKIHHQKTPSPPPLPSQGSNFPFRPQEPRSLQKLRRPEASICMCQHQGAGRRRWNGHQGGLVWLDVGQGRWACRNPWDDFWFTYIYHTKSTTTIHCRQKIYHTSM